MPEPAPYPATDEVGKDLLNRFTYHPPVAGLDQTQRYGRIRAMALEFASRLTAMCPPSRERSLALTNLEQTVMWANAAIARHESPSRQTPERVADSERVDSLPGLRELGAE